MLREKCIWVESLLSPGSPSVCCSFHHSRQIYENPLLLVWHVHLLLEAPLKGEGCTGRRPPLSASYLKALKGDFQSGTCDKRSVRRWEEKRNSLQSEIDTNNSITSPYTQCAKSIMHSTCTEHLTAGLTTVMLHSGGLCAARRKLWVKINRLEEILKRGASFFLFF